MLYGPEMVDRAEAEKSGLAEYHTLPRDANLSHIYGASEPKSFDRFRSGWLRGRAGGL